MAVDFLARCVVTWPVSPMLWWRHQAETFSALLAICAGNSPVTGEFPPQRPVTQSFDVYFDLRVNKRWSKQSWGWWFETPSFPLWRQSNDIVTFLDDSILNELSPRQSNHDDMQCMTDRIWTVHFGRQSPSTISVLIAHQTYRSSVVTYEEYLQMRCKHA